LKGGCKSDEEELSEVRKMIDGFLGSSYNSLGIICKTQGQAERLHESLKEHYNQLYLLNSQSTAFVNGIIIATAHMAKGLEFDHVAILNGGWERPSRGEDADAPRRLFYVAMTRARSTLTVLTDGPHVFVRQDDAVLSRRVTPDTAALPPARLRYVPPDPTLVDLSFAGRLADGAPSLAAYQINAIVFKNSMNGFSACCGSGNPEIKRIEYLFEVLETVIIVLGNKYMLIPKYNLGFSSGNFRRTFHNTMLIVYSKIECCAFSFLRLQPDLSSQGFNTCFYNSQPQSGSPV